MDFELICPFCNKVMTVKADWCGKVVICPSCNGGVIVPEIGSGKTEALQQSTTFHLEEKSLSAAEERLLLAKLDAIRAECEIEDYPAWKKGLRSLLFAAVPCMLILLIMLTTGAAGNIIYVSAGCSLVFMGIIWTFATFRNPG